MLIVSLVLTLASSLQVPGTGPDPKRVEAAVSEIEGAFKEGKTADDKVAAIRKNREVLDARVITAITKGFKDKDQAVQSAAVDALGHMAHPEALEALHRLYKADKQRLKDDEKVLPLLLKSIGRHGSEKSVDLLADDVFLQRTFPAIQARVLSLGNIRSKKSVEALMDIMAKAGTRQINDYMNLFRQSLVRLTGQDQGPDSAMWTKWWQDNKAKFEVSKEVPQLPEIAAKAWSEYWGEAAPKPQDKSTEKKPEPKKD